MMASLSRRSVFAGWPCGPMACKLTDKATRIMDVILHLGAHRCASTTFQAYCDANAKSLRGQGILAWGPKRTRKGGVLSGILPETGVVAPAEDQFDAARRRLQNTLDRVGKRGIDGLIVADENIIGTMRRNLRRQALYADAEQRIGRYARAFEGRVTRLVLSVRALDRYWASALAYGVGRGLPLPTPRDLDAIAENPRGWRDLVEAAHRAFPGAEILVQRHETHAGLPEWRLAHALGWDRAGPMRHARIWLHRAPDLTDLRHVLAARGEDPGKLPRGQGRWMPFSDDQRAALRETWADDMFWLTAGGGGFATLLEEDTTRNHAPGVAGADKAGQPAAPHRAGAQRRGHDNDGQDGGLAQAG